ncbi:MAG: glucose 1-dehydrogenase [Thermodesulfobacteriota bacterium]
MEKSESASNRRHYGLAGHVALVTGGGQGIGRAVALGLAREDVIVLVNGRTWEKLEKVVQEIEASGGQALGLAAHVENKEEVAAMVDQAIKAFGRIDFLVNNAGVSRSAFFTEMTEEDWDLVLDINLKGSFLVGQAVARHMIENGFGRIVNLCSIASFAGQEGRANYASSKAGLLALTQVMAQELARYNIRVNAVAPALIETELIRRAVPKDFLEEVILDRKPLGRMGQPEEVAEVILFLLSEGSNYMTGETVKVDGGLLSGYFYSSRHYGQSFSRKK